MREIRWTEESEEHIWVRHRVTTAEVEQVVNGQDRAEESSRDTTKVFGQTDAGRYLAVLLVDAVDGRDYVVTARDMTQKERRTFRRRSGRPH